ncbi:YbaK/EbsC family protein [Gryllotalpicola reticulitermitis]|uniref:YbaK/EbsC family protein n=1 Tax=Gryllotalpicola reticulitermitis TaxID=1184153 RepID=A0ABV8Q5Z7_9MICO
MSLESVRQHLKAFGRDGDILEFATSSATVDEAAAAIGVPPEEIAKTLSVYSADGGSAVLIVVAGDAKLSSGKFKRRFGHKPRFLAADDVEPLTSHPVGGVCPFGVPEGTAVWLDESLRRFARVYPAAGSRSSAIGVDITELESLTGAAGWVDLSQDTETAV